MNRITCLLLLSLGLLAACEPEPVAEKPAAQAPAATQQSEPQTPAAPQPMAPKPAAEGVEAVEESAQAATKAPPPAAPSHKPSQPEPPLVLDLSVPEELLEQLPSEVGSSELPPLLPPLFVEKEAPVSPFQLSGRLISNERVDDYWDSIEGAELQFEFKQ